MSIYTAVFVWLSIAIFLNVRYLTPWGASRLLKTTPLRVYKLLTIWFWPLYYPVLWSLTAFLFIRDYIRLQRKLHPLDEPRKLTDEERVKYAYRFWGLAFNECNAPTLTDKLNRYKVPTHSNQLTDAEKKYLNI